MANLEQPNIQTAEVHELDQYRSAEQTYAAFYQLYGGENFQFDDGSTSRYMLLGGQVLHFDAVGNDVPQDRSMHMIIREKDGVLNPRIQRRGSKKTGFEFTVPYRFDNYLVVSTDGDSIQRWEIKNMLGTYEGHIDPIVNQYRPEKEIIHLGLIALSEGAQNSIKLEINAAHRTGSAVLGNGRKGWLLSYQDSRPDRELILGSVAESSGASEAPIPITGRVAAEAG